MMKRSKRHLKSTGNIELDIAKMRVHEMKRFYNHLFIYAIGVVLYIGKTYFGWAINFWPINFINEFFMWAWTFIIAVQGIKLFFKERFFGTKWEKRKINEMMEKEKTATTKWD